MPCQSYDSSWDHGPDERKIRELKKQADMLARIACKALTELEKNEVEDMLLLGDDEVRTWWAAHKEADRKEQARLVEKQRRERVRAEALAKLSSEERELLGLDVKTGSKKKRTGTVVPSDQVIEEIAYDLDELLKQVNGGKWK